MSLTSTVSSQVEEKDLYLLAYDYLNDSTVEGRSFDEKAFRKDCSKYYRVRGRRLKYEADLQVAGRFIQNNRGFPLCDLLKRNYKVEVSCPYAIGSGKFPLLNQVQDSLKVFWAEYEMKSDNEISEVLGELISEKKDGLVVFFSDIYKNTLMAEVMPFCQPYERDRWMGHSNSYYFIFNDNGEIEEVYSGVVIHYNWS